MMRCRRGFTIVELLVTIAIVSTLLALLLPAVQRARAAGQRIACANHLRQLGIALHLHHNTYGHFPSGRGTPTPLIFSPQAFVLPFVEQGSLSESIDFQSPPASFTIPPTTVYDGSKNAPAASYAPVVLQCPADGLAGRVPSSTFGGTNYVACVGSGANSGTMTNADGMFFLGSKMGIRDILDGTSTTAAFSERLLGAGLPANSPGERRLVMREIPNSAEVNGPNCQPPAAGVWNHERGAKWIVGNYGNTLYNHALPPNSREHDCLTGTQQKARAAARSNHDGGVHVAFCDGSLQLVSDEIDLWIWQAYATRAGGEVW